MSNDLARGIAVCRILRELGSPVYLLRLREAGVTWVGTGGSAIDNNEPVKRDDKRFYSALRSGRKPVFFMLGSGDADGRNEPARMLCISPDIEILIHVSGGIQVDCHVQPTAKLKTLLDVVQTIPPAAPPSRKPVSPDIMSGWETEPDNVFNARMDHAITLVKGRTGKLITTRGFRRQVNSSLDPLDLAWLLAESEPDAPAFHYLQLPDGMTSLGTSPENVFELQHGNLHLDAIAGTRRVDPDTHQDKGLEAELLASGKERYEHAAALQRGVDFAKKTCVPDSVRTVFERRIRRLRHVRHLWSRVEGKLAPHLDGVDLIEQSFPPLTSYPPDLANQAELVLSPPVFYGGLVGRLDINGNVHTFLNLRSIEAQPGMLLTRAGVGVVNGSTRIGETREILGKLHAIHEAVENWI